MASRSNRHFTVDEYIAVLRRSQIPTIIVEGNDDIVVYRFIEKTLGATAVSVLPVGGRENVLEIFQRRGELNVPVFFIADRDNWCITGVPEEFSSDQLALTNGYSIENDVIHDGELLAYLTPQESDRLKSELETFIEWYALALSRHLRAVGAVIKTHPNAILDDAANRARLCLLIEGESYPQALRERLLAAPFELIRGKSVFAMLMRHLSYQDRQPRHHHLALMEVVGAKPGHYIGSIFQRVSKFLDLASQNGTATAS